MDNEPFLSWDGCEHTAAGGQSNERAICDELCHKDKLHISLHHAETSRAQYHWRMMLSLEYFYCCCGLTYSQQRTKWNVWYQETGLFKIQTGKTCCDVFSVVNGTYRYKTYRYGVKGIELIATLLFTIWTHVQTRGICFIFFYANIFFKHAARCPRRQLPNLSRQ